MRAAAWTAMLIFIGGISGNFKVTLELAQLHSAHQGTTGKEAFEEASAVVVRLQLPWNKVARIGTDGTPAMGGTERGALSALQCMMKRLSVNSNQTVLFCAIHQELHSPLFSYLLAAYSLICQ